MLFRRFGAVLFVIALAGASAKGFKFDLHVQITQEALSDEELKSWIQNPPSGMTSEVLFPAFSKKAMKEITDANMAKDTGDCGTPGDSTVPAKPCGSEALNRYDVQALRRVESTPHKEHFDNEHIQEGSSQLFQTRTEIIDDLSKRNFVGARKKLGGALHAIQDFYAHTNWVEMFGRSRIEGRLGASDDAFSRGTPPLAGNQPTCDAYTQNGYSIVGGVLKPNLRVLTSGYFFIGPDVPSSLILPDPPLPIPDEVATGGKCRHGWELDPQFGTKYTQPGINKDDPSRPGYATAWALAVAHTSFFMKELLARAAQFPIDRRETMILGLLGHPIVSDAALQQTQGSFLLEVTGADFLPTSMISWDGSPLETEFVNSTTLRASVDSSRLAKPGTVQIGVRSPLTEDQEPANGGTWAPMVLSSNLRPLPVDPPGGPTLCPHRPDPEYFDVDAKKWNDTGRMVKTGDRFDIRVPAGRIVWRKGLLFDDTAPPQGDPSVTPYNTLLWIDPPIAITEAPLGALIGMILDPQARQTSSNPLEKIEKPDGAKFFTIRTGGRFTMPASGKLYLGVNDGAFFNNAGCFQARITPAL